MFHPDWCIDEFRSCQKVAQQYQTKKDTNYNYFQNLISFFCEMEELSHLSAHAANPRWSPEDNRMGFP